MFTVGDVVVLVFPVVILGVYEACQVDNGSELSWLLHPSCCSTLVFCYKYYSGS